MRGVSKLSITNDFEELQVHNENFEPEHFRPAIKVYDAYVVDSFGDTITLQAHKAFP